MNDLDLLYDSCSGFVSDFNNFFNTRPLAIKWNQSLADWLTYLKVSGQDVHSLTSDPLFVNPAAFDFSLQSESPLIGKGTVLARTINAGSGKTITVTDVSDFSDGFGIGSGDFVLVGNSHVKIIAIDYIDHSISVDRVINWDKNDAVSFPFDGIAPNMGASNTP
jgi:hypothetical protein